MRWMRDLDEMEKFLEVIRHRSRKPGRLSQALMALGLVGIAAAVVANASDARAAASQDWSPFVLVSGLLLIGLVANDDGLFDSAGGQLARLSTNGFVLFLGASLMIATTTALLNLDTSVAFLTPILIYTARRRGGGEAPLLYGCLLLSNAGSLFLPGSNLTNLIVLGHFHLSGAAFFADMWMPALAALVVTGFVIVLFEHRTLGLSALAPAPVPRPTWGLGFVAVLLATVLVLVLSAPALPVAAVGLVAVIVRLVKRRENIRHVLEVLGLPVLVGLFGVAVTLGALGRLWSGPSVMLGHLDTWATAGVSSVVSVLVNNLPAASLLAARVPAHPFALLIGLNLGPNFFVTGSLAWVLWWRAARGAGARPSLARASRIGVVAAPLSMAAALLVLSAKGLA